MPELIPNRLVFIWIGETLPWSCQLAIKSAIAHCTPQQVILLHKGLTNNLKELTKAMGSDCPEIIEFTLQHFRDLPLSKKLSDELYHNLTKPAALANVLRLATLYKEGGIYMDGDTITIADLKPLRQYRGFCGLEPLALPSQLFQSINPFKWSAAGIRLALRELCARWPGGHQLFRNIEPWYFSCVNNAVIGYAPGNPLIANACQLIEQMPPLERLKRFRLGTHLLQQVTGNQSTPDMEVLPPDFFYPLGPEISAQWFRPQSPAREKIMLSENTKVVHWYNSVEARFLKREFNLEFIQENQHLPICRLAKPYV
ncbi:MAG: hypothetical protein HQK83_00530 [Fibrobacteria bacterium]|nr:hypothetical protein [Fibrobacteria bacterium]